MARNDNQNDIDDSAFAWGMIFGLIFGALAALLRAPKSGAATRRELVGGIAETGQNLRESIETVGETVSNRVETVTEKVTDTLTPSDPIADSIAEGKAAARRRRAELGLGENDAV